MTAPTTLIEELERALAAGSDAQRADMLSRLTDLFVGGSPSFSSAQVNLFDEVIGKLTTTIEAKARVKLSIRLAEVANAPSGVIRTLAFDDDIEVARPVLARSDRLGEADLIVNARSKGQQHLAAIAERKTLSEAVTDVLVTRGDQQVARSVAKNRGARFSDAGFRMLVKRSAGDDTLALHVGGRQDVPRQHFLNLLEQASAAVRARLAAENPTAGAAVDGVLTEVVGNIRSETRKVSLDYSNAMARLQTDKESGRLGEAEVYKFAREKRFEETVVAMSLLCGIEIDVVERALHDRSHDIALILAKLAEFSSTGAKAILLLKSAERGISPQDLDAAMQSYEKLQLDTARRVLGFYHNRMRSGGPAAASA